jgi:hypothetical protein
MNPDWAKAVLKLMSTRIHRNIVKIGCVVKIVENTNVFGGHGKHG